MVIDWTGTPYYNLGSPTGGLSGQIQLFENGRIEVHVTVADHGVSTSVSGLGVETQPVQMVLHRQDAMVELQHGT